jgi:uncharacterized OB-fold protein
VREPPAGDHADDAILSARYVLEYPYRRSLGPVVGRFLAGLAERRILGARAADGRVFVPPTEYDPRTGDAIAELVEVADEGVVTSFTWVARPGPKQPLGRPFAWALVRLDGADTALLHVVDAPGPESLRTGMRVRARFAEVPTGSIRDIACFEPVSDSDRRPSRDDMHARSAASIAPLRTIKVPTRLEYEVVAGRAASRFLRALAEGRLVGQRCPRCAKVYLPPRGSCPVCAVPTDEEVQLPDSGTVTTFCVVNVPSESLPIPIPYVAASVKIDGADTALFHLVRGIAPSEVRMGLRVRAEWKPREEWAPTLESIRHFAPTGEPDAPWSSYQGAL